MKLLPVALAVTATLSSFSIFAEADPLDNIQLDDQQPLVISPQTDIPDGIVFLDMLVMVFIFQMMLKSMYLPMAN